MKCNGKKSIKDISLETDYDCESIIKFLTGLSGGRRAMVTFNDKPTPKKPVVIGSSDIYIPLHIVFELTYKCNLKCMHCYTAGRPTDEENNTKMILDILNKLANMGTQSIELTGGEPTIHPDIKKIATYALQKFELVGLITNGTLLNEEIINIFSDFKEKTVVQTSLHSSTPTWHDTFTQVKGSWEKTLNSIKLLSKKGIPTRVVTMVTPSNINDIKDIASFIHDLGITWYSATIPAEMGRGAYACSKEIFLSKKEEIEKIIEIAKKLKNDWGKFITTLSKEDPFKDAYGNCGAGTKNMVISPFGDIRPCVMLSASYLSFGNVSQKPLEEVLRNNIIGSFSNLRAPDEEGCGDCRNLYFCKDCIIRGIYKYKELKKNCKWGRKNLKELNYVTD